VDLDQDAAALDAAAQLFDVRTRGRLRRVRDVEQRALELLEHVGDRCVTGFGGAAPVDPVRGRELAIIFQDPTSSLTPIFPVGYQIVEARAAGADAVLLIARMLDIDGLRELYAVAEELGLSVLVETHSEAEIDAAIQIGARIIGINNRNLDTMTISLDTTRRLAHLVPKDVVLVAESGIRSGFDVASLGAAGASAFLVGGSLLDAEDPGALLRELVVAAEGSATMRGSKAAS